MYANGDIVIYFDSFEVEYVLKEIKKFIDNKNIITNTYRIQTNDSIMYGYVCIRLMDFMLNGKKNLKRTIYEKNNKIILEFFQ